MRKLIVGVAIGIFIGSASTLMARSHIEDVDTLLSYLRGWFHDVESRADSRHQATAETLRRIKADLKDLKSNLKDLKSNQGDLKSKVAQVHDVLTIECMALQIGTYSQRTWRERRRVPRSAAIHGGLYIKLSPNEWVASPAREELPRCEDVFGWSTFTGPPLESKMLPLESNIAITARILDGLHRKPTGRPTIAPIP